MRQRNFPGGPVVKDLPVEAGDTSFIPGPGRLHMPRGNKACMSQLLSPSTATTEAKRCLGSVAVTYRLCCPTATMRGATK